MRTPDARSGLAAKRQGMDMLVKNWSYGDKVLHLERPEWGLGLVTATATDSYEGRPSQRVTVRFERAGVKTLNTGIANLVPSDDATAAALQAASNHHDHERSTGEADPLRLGGGPSLKDLLLRLPDECTDPFVSPRARLDATLRLFRFSEQGGQLIDWAAAQLGVKDPLSSFSRHELEQHYRRFVQIRDEQLKKVMMDVKKSDPLLLREVMRTASKQTAAVLRRHEGR